MHRMREKRLNLWRLGRFLFRSIDRGGQAPAMRWADGGTRFSFLVGRGPVPRHAADERKRLNPWRLGRFSFRLSDRGGQAPALRWAGGTRLPFTVGRGPVPRHAADKRKRLNPWRLGRFLLCSNARGGQAPALRYREGLCIKHASRGTGPRATLHTAGIFPLKN